MRADTFELEADDGVHIHVHRWLPEEAPRATVQIAHGIAEHGARYAGFAEAAAARGFAVYVQDHRGHGQTAERSGALLGHLGDEGGWERVVDDLERLHHHIGEVHPDTPRFFLGHSMGTTLGQHLLWRRPEGFSGAIFSAPTNDPGLLGKVALPIIMLERARLGRRGFSGLLQKLAFDPIIKAVKPRRTDFDWLNRVEAAVDKYIDDPLCGFEVTTQFWLEHAPAIVALYKKENHRRLAPDLPVLFVVGSEDPVAGGAASVRALQAGYDEAGVKRVETRVYEGARHELLHEENREEVIDDLLGWMEARLEG